jgi:transposase InsO family protein
VVRQPRPAHSRQVCLAFVEAMRVYGVPEEVLTDNGKVFTGRFHKPGVPVEVLFDKICRENGIRHLLTAPYSPTTTGKVERLQCATRRLCAVRRWESKEVQDLLVRLSQQLDGS